MRVVQRRLWVRGAILVGVVLMVAAMLPRGALGQGERDKAETVGYQLLWYTIDGGGATFSSGAGYELSGTIGQPDAGEPMTGDDFELTGGFWFGLVPGDCNADGGVNLFDFDELADCTTGPDGGLPGECICYDLDRDGDVDLYDFAHFQSAFSGS